MLQERRLGEASEWSPWLKTLPKCFPHTVFWSEDELAQLEGSFAWSGSQQRLEIVAEEWERVKRHCHPDDTLEDFKWAHCAVSSRSFDFGAAGGSMLAPLSDLFNHSNDANVVYGPGDNGSFEFTFSRDVEPGEEIEITYGLYSNRKLLQQYGFALRGNTDDKVKFCLNLSPECPGYKEKQRCLDRLGLTREHHWLHPIRLGPEGGLVRRDAPQIPTEPIDAVLMATLRVQTHNAEAGDPSLASLDRNRVESNLGSRNEAEAWYTLLTLIQSLLDRYPTSLEEDRRDLEKLDVSVSPSTRLRDALVLRVGEKSILEQNLVYVQEALDAAVKVWQRDGGGGEHAAPKKRGPRSKGGKLKKKR